MTDTPVLRSQEPSDLEKAGRPATPRHPRTHAWRRALSFGNISAVYVLVVLLIGFAIWVPEFYTPQIFKTLLYQQAVTTMVAIALVIPLAAGVYDLSVGAVVGMCSVTLAWSSVVKDQPLAVALAITLAVGIAVGLVNALLVLKWKVQSLIATLAMSSVLAALGVAVSGNVQITGIPTSLQSFSTFEFLGVSAPVYVLLALCIVVWYVMEHTPAGRALFATGGNIEAARLAGVRTGRVICLALVASAVIAALAGVMATARTGLGEPNIGPPFLLPAFGAAFLGATQLKRGQFNVWGTVLATYVLASGVKGLQLGGAPFWLPDLFNGVALALAVGISGWQRRPSAPASSRRWFGVRRGSTEAQHVAA